MSSLAPLSNFKSVPSLQMKYLLPFLLGQILLINAQVVGTVTNEQGDPLPFVNIYFESTANGTTTNENGEFNLELNSTGTRLTLHMGGALSLISAIDTGGLV
ncbi:MAG: carboxypeptidase-like regulatory domain-containing protein, partial [Bacteroidota bacterium]